MTKTARASAHLVLNAVNASHARMVVCNEWAKQGIQIEGSILLEPRMPYETWIEVKTGDYMVRQ